MDEREAQPQPQPPAPVEEPTPARAPTPPMPEEDEEQQQPASSPAFDPMSLLMETLTEDGVETLDAYEGLRERQQQKQADDAKTIRAKAEAEERKAQAELRREAERAKGLERVAREMAKAAEAQAQAERDGMAADEMSERMSLWRQHVRYREEMNCPGTGARLNPISSPLDKLRAEIEVQNTQAIQQYGGDVVRGMLFRGAGMAESAVKAFSPANDITGFQATLQKLVEVDPQFDLMLKHLEIKHAHRFSVNVEAAVAWKVAQVALTVRELNRRSRV